MAVQDDPVEERRAPATPAERIHAARFVLLAAAALLFAASLLWAVPLVFPIFGALALVGMAAFVPRRRAPLSGPRSEAARARVWPDASMKAMLEAFSQPGFILDTEGNVRYANARAAALFPGTRPGDPFGLTFRAPDISVALAAAFRGETQSVEHRLVGESPTVAAVRFSPLHAIGGPKFLLVTFEDVSDRLAIARMRADFVANASHELRTPLASLTGFIETLLGPARNDPAAAEKFLGIMLDQARRMRRLIDDLLSLSRLEMRVHHRPTDLVDLSAVLSHVAESLAPLAAEQGVGLDVSVPEQTLDVLGDRDELVQVFQNLVENGIRYGASGERVEVRQELRGPEVAVHVRDFGPGIPTEHLPRLTERFYRVDVGASREMKGTGLGLAIVKHILTRHQARLEIDSRPGEGARFTVLLPLAPAVSHQNRESQ